MSLNNSASQAATSMMSQDLSDDLLHLMAPAMMRMAPSIGETLDAFLIRSTRAQIIQTNCGDARHHKWKDVSLFELFESVEEYSQNTSYIKHHF